MNLPCQNHLNVHTIVLNERNRLYVNLIHQNNLTQLKAQGFPFEEQILFGESVFSHIIDKIPGLNTTRVPDGIWFDFRPDLTAEEEAILDTIYMLRECPYLLPARFSPGSRQLERYFGGFALSEDSIIKSSLISMGQLYSSNIAETADPAQSCSEEEQTIARSEFLDHSFHAESQYVFIGDCATPVYITFSHLSKLCSTLLIIVHLLDEKGGIVVLGTGTANITTTLYYNSEWRTQRKPIQILLPMKLKGQTDPKWYFMTLPPRHKRIQLNWFDVPQSQSIDTSASARYANALAELQEQSDYERNLSDSENSSAKNDESTTEGTNDGDTASMSEESEDTGTSSDRAKSNTSVNLGNLGEVDGSDATPSEKENLRSPLNGSLDRPIETGYWMFSDSCVDCDQYMSSCSLRDRLLIIERLDLWFIAAMQLRRILHEPMVASEAQQTIPEPQILSVNHTKRRRGLSI
jgi:hypothetical protein